MPASTHSQDESMPDAAPQSHEQEPQIEDEEEDTIELNGQRITIVSDVSLYSPPFFTVLLGPTYAGGCRSGLPWLSGN